VNVTAGYLRRLALLLGPESRAEILADPNHPRIPLLRHEKAWINAGAPAGELYCTHVRNRGPKRKVAA
jgi:hypothetical protein